MADEKKSLGIIGLGAFGRFMVRHLAPHYRLLGCDPAMPSPEKLRDDQAEAVTLAPLADVAACDIVVFAVPLDDLEKAAAEAAPRIRPGALAMDVTSVKIRPLEILRRVIPEHADLLGCHPLFGPQSGRNGIAGLRVALCPVRMPADRYYRVCDFLTDRLRLLVLKTDPDTHDREMAKVQAMTHFMSRALREIGLEPSPMATRAYEKLQEFASIALSDSWDLFLTIENGNPHAEELRRRLVSELQRLEDKLDH
ncbi:MAG: prephenate dehydrogenase [Planctomycetota bacterium]|jgi:prephenate dehydrogenase|nr:prephenate dehydrogenase [Planctomycetota bacterium]